MHVSAMATLRNHLLNGSEVAQPANNLDRGKAHSTNLDATKVRFNNRDNPYLFRDTLLRLIDADALPYEELTATS